MRIQTKWIGWLLLATAGCMAKPMGTTSMDASARGEAAPSSPSTVMPAPTRGIPTMPSGRSYQNAPPRTTPPSPANSSAPQTQAPVARMVHYAGYAQLRVEQPSESIDQLTALVKSKGGYVEQLTGTTIIVRVPVADFSPIFEQVLGMGEVLSRQLAAEDVTESFTAIDLRLSSAKAQQARLIDLLARAKTEQEKIALVQQIQQVTEQIDTLEAQLRTLKGLADYSRITVAFVRRVPLSGGSGVNEANAFAWISHLKPFVQTLKSHGAPVTLTVPEGLVLLTRKPFVAESADGARLWTSRIPNEPEGDNAFWMDAMKQRLAPEFASATVQNIGGWSLLRLVDHAAPAYRYLVGVRAMGRDLEVVEIYYPSKEREDRYHRAVETVLAEGQPVVDVQPVEPMPAPDVILSPTNIPSGGPR